MLCKACGGAAHPATGHYHTPTMLICGPCIRKFYAWTAGWTKQGRKVKGTKVSVYFYDCAVKEFPR